MKILFKILTALAIVLVAAVHVQAQRRITAKALETLQDNLKETPLLVDTDEDFGKAAVVKQDSETAVILCQKTSFDYDKKGLTAGKRIGRNIMGLLLAVPTLGMSVVAVNKANDTKMLIEERERRKIQLNDKYAIEKYSMLYFRLSTDKDAFNARVIKADGSIQKVDFTDAVAVDDIRAVPDLFRSYSDERFSVRYRPDFYKVVVPDLQEGDILEYEFLNLNSVFNYYNPAIREFAPIYYQVSRPLPVQKQIMEVILQDDHYHFGSKSMMGAPEFQKTAAGDKILYRWMDVNRSKVNDTRFSNNYLDLPMVKFQVVYGKESQQDYMFVKPESTVREALTEDEFKNKVQAIWFNAASKNRDGSNDLEESWKLIYPEVKKNKTMDNEDEEFARKIYYTLRANTMKQEMADYRYAKIMAHYLEKKKYAYEIVASYAGNISSLANLCFVKEIRWAIKYNNKYYCNPGDHYNPGEIPDWLQGSKAVLFADDEDKKTATLVKLPVADTLANKVVYNLKTSLNAERMDLKLDENVNASGLSKHSMIDDILVYTPYEENDYKNYDGENPLDIQNDKLREESEERVAKQKKEWKEAKAEIARQALENSLGKEIEGDVTFRVSNDGRNARKPDLVYNQSYTISGLTAKAGNDLVLSLPAVIGKQTLLKPGEQTRTLDADMAFPRMIIWNITMDIPAGYSVLGLSSLNKLVRNEAGVFECAARTENNQVILNVKKQYSIKKVTAAQWPQVASMLDLAFNWSQLKIVLRKN